MKKQEGGEGPVTLFCGKTFIKKRHHVFSNFPTYLSALFLAFKISFHHILGNGHVNTVLERDNTNLRHG